jgi:hypothetical protein
MDDAAVFGDIVLEATAAFSAHLVRIDLDQVNRVTATGLGRFEFFLENAPFLCVLSGVPPVLLAALGRAPLRETAVESVWLPVRCGHCGAQFEAKAEHRQLLALAERTGGATAPCACGAGDAAPDAFALVAALALPHSTTSPATASEEAAVERLPVRAGSASTVESPSPEAPPADPEATTEAPLLCPESVTTNRRARRFAGEGPQNHATVRSDDHLSSGLERP